MTPSIDLEGVTRRDVSVGMLAGFGALVVIDGYLLVSAVGLGLDGAWSDAGVQLLAALAVTAFGLWFAYMAAQPDIDEKCDACGKRVTVDSAREGQDLAVLVEATDSPRRARVGSQSIVMGREQYKRVYCSPACAEYALDEPGNPLTTDTPDEDADWRQEVA